MIIQLLSSGPIWVISQGANHYEVWCTNVLPCMQIWKALCMLLCCGFTLLLLVTQECLMDSLQIYRNGSNWPRRWGPGSCFVEELLRIWSVGSMGDWQNYWVSGAWQSWRLWFCWGHFSWYTHFFQESNWIGGSLGLKWCLKSCLSVKVYFSLELKRKLLVKTSREVPLRSDSSVRQPVMTLMVVEDIWHREGSIWRNSLWWGCTICLPSPWGPHGSSARVIRGCHDLAGSLQNGIGANLIHVRYQLT